MRGTIAIQLTTLMFCFFLASCREQRRSDAPPQPEETVKEEPTLFFQSTSVPLPSTEDWGDPDSVIMVDTVYFDQVDSLYQVYSSFLGHLDSLQQALETALSDTKSRIERNKKELDLTSQEELQQQWKEIISAEKTSHENYRVALASVTLTRSEAQSMAATLAPLSNSGKDGIAYFVLKEMWISSAPGKQGHLLISPDSQVLGSYAIPGEPLLVRMQMDTTQFP